jgi:hypothetical protein
MRVYMIERGSQESLEGEIVPLKTIIWDLISCQHKFYSRKKDDMQICQLPMKVTDKDP